LTALSLTLLAGCGGEAAEVPGAGAPKADASADASSTTGAASDADANEVKAQNMIADCMKGKGFRYIPHLANYGTGGDDAAKFAGYLSILEPPEQVRTFRAKYGFGVYSQAVYPNDPAIVVKQPDPNENPNKAVRAALDPAQQKAYDIALDGVSGHPTIGGKLPPELQKAIADSCGGQASAKYPTGAGRTKEQEEAAGREYAKFQNDPAVVAAARKWADCLKDKGYRVTTAKPGSIEQSMFNDASGKVTDPGSVSAAAAKTGLANEIKAALDDLDCRTEYATIARTRFAATIRAGGVG
jgi:hypothetical protein